MFNEDDIIEEEEEEDRISQQQECDGRMLTFNEAGCCLSVLGKDQSGLRYAYLLMAPVGRNLSDISVITQFKHILFVNVSNNKLIIENIQCLEQLPYLLSLQCDNNLIDSCAIGELKYLQILTLNSNIIQSVASIRQPQLERLELNYNKITDIDELNGDNLPNLKFLTVCYNNIKVLPSINFELLDSLYLGYNKIERIFDLSKLVNLRVLHLRNNRIKRLRNAFSSKMKKLQYINLRENLIDKIIRFQRLRCLPNLEALIFLNNPLISQELHVNEVEEEEEAPLTNYRIELLGILPNLKRINKDIVTLEEQQQAYAEEADKHVEFEESDESLAPVQSGSLVNLFEYDGEESNENLEFE